MSNRIVDRTDIIVYAVIAAVATAWMAWALLASDHVAYRQPRHAEYQGAIEYVREHLCPADPERATEWVNRIRTETSREYAAPPTTLAAAEVCPGG